MPPSPPIHRFTLLGGAVIRENGTPLGGPAAHRHRIALLALLVASRAPVSRDKLLAYLWPERDAESSRNLLKVAVHELRKLLGDDAIRSTGDQLSVDPAALPSDLFDLEAAAGAGEYAKAAALYTGPFLDGFHMKDAPEFERWAESQRNRLGTLASGAFEQLALAAQRQGDWRAAAGWWRRLAAEDPLRVDVALNVMRALENAGDRAGALRHAEIHSDLRKREVGLDADASVIGLARDLAQRPERKRTTPVDKAFEQVVAEVPATPAPVLTRRPLTRNALVGVAVALVLVVTIAMTIGMVTNRRMDARSRVSDALAVIPFRVVGADSSLGYLGDGLLEMFVARIGDEGPMRAVEARGSAGASDDQLPVAIQQGKAVGAGKVLVGDVVGSGHGDVDVTATIYNTSDAGVVSRATRTIARGASMPAVIDTLAAELMSRAAGEPVDRLPDLTRRPLSALRLYLAAQVAYRRGAYQRAESLFAKSLDVDSSFTLAGLGLALANSWTTINDHYGLGRDVALRGINELGARDRLFVNAFFGPDPQLGEPKPAPVYLQAWEDVVHKHPDFAEAWYHVGDRYYHFGGLSGLADPQDQARTAFRRALAIDSGLVAPLHHLIEIYASRGEGDEALATAEQYFRNNPGVSRDASAIGWTVATVTKDEKWLARVRASFGSMPLADLGRIAWITQANGWAPADADSALTVLEQRASATFERSTAAGVRYAFSLNAGRIADARAVATRFESQLPDQPIGALWSAYAVMFGDADTTGLGENLRALAAFGSLPLTGNPDHRSRQVQARCLVAYAKLGVGNPAAAAADLAGVRRAGTTEPVGSVPRREADMCVGWLGAAIAVEMHSATEPALVARLDTIVLRDRVPPRMSLAAMAVVAARLHEKRGELKQALAASRWREHYTGDPVFLATQLRLEGDLARQLGDVASARRAYRHYLALRPAPDAGAAAAATEIVRRELAALDSR
jgi:DNA-binding SARP family transcriptional activator